MQINPTLSYCSKENRMWANYIHPSLGLFFYIVKNKDIQKL